jgi:hypothetical protein
MSNITPRLIPKQREPPKSGNVLMGQQTYLLGRSPLRCYYYNKQGRGRWSSADRAVYGMRWNAYLVSGKATPMFERLQHERLQSASGLMKEIETKKSRDRSGTLSLEAYEKRSHTKKAARTKLSIETEKPQEQQIVPISRHTGFRHLHALKAEGHTEGSVLQMEARRDGRNARNAIPESRVEADIETLARKEQIDSKQGALQPEVRERKQDYAIARGETIVPRNQGSQHIQETKIHDARIEQPTDPLSFNYDEPRPETLQKTPKIAGNEAMSFSISITEKPANDNHVPNEPEPEAFFSLPVQVSARLSAPLETSQQDMERTRRVGYISSRRRRSFQLLIAQGAAALPQ